MLHDTVACSCVMAGRMMRKSSDWRQSFKEQVRSADIALHGEDIVCMTCFQTGHSVCPGPYQMSETCTPPALFCPNCGCSGHHVDYPERNAYNQCLAPRYDAYNKFGNCKSYFFKRLSPYFLTLPCDFDSDASAGRPAAWQYR